MHTKQVRELRAKKSAPPPVATVPVTAEPAQLQAPVGASWFWGGQGGGGPEPNPDAADLKPLFQHLPFRWVGVWVGGRKGEELRFEPQHLTWLPLFRSAAELAFALPC